VDGKAGKAKTNQKYNCKQTTHGVTSDYFLGGDAPQCLDAMIAGNCGKIAVYNRFFSDDYRKQFCVP
jgi:hypothetical protein